MIIQGTNLPLVVTFDADVSETAALVITLWRRNGTELKRWTKNDMQITEDTVELPLTEEETAAFPEGYNTLEAKGLDEYGQTIFWEAMPLLVEGRRDKGISITGG